MFTTGVYKAM